ncbi:MAG: 1,4-dihydroxy-2-naphthoate polyprenyltransferase [Candidatus Eisenbacteria bacterium]
MTPATTVRPPQRRLPASPLALWWTAARPRTLPAAIAPVIVGTAIAAAAHAFRPLVALAALLGAVWIQIGTNFANDYFDWKHGADAARQGPLRVTQAGLVTGRQMRVAIAIAFAAATACGVSLVAAAGWPVVAIGVLSILAGLAYTGGPWPLGYHGLGELFVLLFFGVVAVCGTYYVQARAVTPLALALSIPVGLLSVAILVVNNLRDEASDRASGKRTLVVRHGGRFGRAEWFAAVGVAFAVPLLLVATRRLEPPALFVLGALALVPSLARTVSGPRPGPALAGTSRLLLVYAFLLSAGLLL